MVRKKQIDDSKDRIANALIHLLDDTSFEDINIKDLADYAQLARMTFYRHFESKEAVIQYIFDNIVNSILDEINSINNPTAFDLIRIRFKVLKESPFLYTFTNNTLISQLLNNFKATNISFFNHLLPNHNNDYIFEFYNGGVDYVTKKWIDNGMKESPELMTEKIISIIKIKF